MEELVQRSMSVLKELISVNRTAQTQLGLISACAALVSLLLAMDSAVQILMSAHWGQTCVLRAARIHQAHTLAAVAQDLR